MRRHRARRCVIAGVAALLAASAAGCKDHAAVGLTTPTRTTAALRSSAAVPTVSAGRPASSAARQARIRASRDAHKPPVDLVWRVPNDPQAWTKLPKKEDGLQVWHVRPGCYVRLWQLDGAGGKDPMTSREVLEEVAADNSSLFPDHPKPRYRSKGTTKLNAFVAGIDDVALVRMADSTVDYGRARARMIAYRDGDLALAYTGYCTTAATFTKVADSDFNPWLSDLAEETTY